MYKGQVLVSEPVAIVGVDVAAPGQARRRQRGNENSAATPNIAELLETFRDVLSVDEKQSIVSVASSESALAAEDLFRRLWSCKEALTKAMGVGLFFELKRASFSLPCTTRTRVTR